MKYLIDNDRLFESIYNFINNEFVDDNLDWDYDINPDTEETETNILNFYGEKYSNGFQDEWTFQYIKRTYYEELQDDYFKNNWIDKAPILEFTDREWTQKMNSIFGDFWKPVFEKWFSENYNQFPVKTFLYS